MNKLLTTIAGIALLLLALTGSAILALEIAERTETPGITITIQAQPRVITGTASDSSEFESPVRRFDDRAIMLPCVNCNYEVTDVSECRSLLAIKGNSEDVTSQLNAAGFSLSEISRIEKREGSSGLSCWYFK